MRWERILLTGALIAAALAVPLEAAARGVAAPAADPLVPASTGGLEMVDRALAKLSSHRRLLVVGAHPDDEDNALLTWVGRGLGGEAAYLSLSRGEGGQNLIGTELGVELGIVRSGELEAARRIEGTRQYFARAYDFGYTRSLDETFERWPREVLLEDAMRAIRRFKPQVIVAVFPGDARAGHGQHQASGLIARQAFAAARDGAEFPALDAEGLDGWKPEALYQRAWSQAQVTGSFDLGVLEPVTGRSLAQIASASRSQHRSQDMGREQRLGQLRGGVVWEAGAGEGGELFAGIDTRLEAISAPLGRHPRAAAVASALAEVAALAATTRDGLTVTGLERAVAPLAQIVGLFDEAIAELSGATAGERVVLDLLREKRALAARALVAAAGVMMDASTDREVAVVGAEVVVTAELWAAGSAPIEAGDVFLSGSLIGSGVTLAPSATERAERTGVVSWEFSFRVPEGAEPTVPYSLGRARRGDLYDWDGVPAADRGEAREAPPLTASFELVVGGTAVRIDREVVFRYGDQALGEVRRPFRVVPELEVEVEEGPVLFNRAVSREMAVEVVVRSNTDREVRGRLSLELPWEPLSQREGPVFRVERSQRESVSELSFEVPTSVEAGRYELVVTASSVTGLLEERGGGNLALPLLEYSHIRPTPAPREARVSLSVFDLELPAVGKVGYVVGASDRVPGVLTSLGLPLEILTAEELTRGDLSAYDAIVVGSRAYEIDPVLVAANRRLLDFARAGGTLIVQYQQYQFVRGEYAPLALSIARPHGRVTDEAAAIDVLEPEHPVFQRPNEIREEDWLGWVQERGLYFADSWHESFLPLLASADPGREPERGALLVAAVGEGFYVYTGLSFFRQLPAGVPGAIRLFANLIGLGSD